jgi:hypothetical protein
MLKLQKKILICIITVITFVIGIFFYNQQADRKLLEVFADTSCVSATGINCTQTTDGSYTINTYTLTGTTTASTTWTPPDGVDEVEYLVVAGGGAGGGGNYHGGGGGAGGFRTATGYTVAFGTLYSVTVGAGGVGTINTAGANGSDSIFNIITSIGGGGGGMYDGVAAKDGGSGGGGGYASTAGSGTSGQGNAGGLGTISANYGNGGGGGANAVGGTGTTTNGGAGGVGKSSLITGTEVYYAGGGGGAIYSSGTPGAGGNGGGGAGSMGAGTSGTANTGGGGGGAERNGTGIAGSGGSGIVVIRYSTVVPSSGSSFTVKKEDGCSCALASECYSDECNDSVCGSEVYTSTNLTCYVTSGTCPGTTIFNLYDQAGGHAELASQLNYTNKVCCTGTGLSNSCTGNHDVVLSLYSETNSHVEKDTESNYTNDVCLHSDSISVVCDYSTDCSLLGSEYVCLASISGDTNAHVGKCSTYTNKVCCMIGAGADNCVAKVISDRSIASEDINIQFCAGADITNEEDPCYNVCWKGTGTPNLDGADWKCGVCHDSSNNHVSCSTLAGTTFNWVMPTGYVLTTDYTLVGTSTLTSANPIINFTNSDNNRIITLNMNSSGTSCSGQNLPRAIPDWKEISPF